MKKRTRFRFTYDSILIVVLVVLIVLFGILIPRNVFFQPVTLIGTTSDVAYLGLMALPMTFVIITSEIDLSVGYMLTASAMIFSEVYAITDTFFIAAACCLFAGTVFGLFNGILVAKTRMHSWLVTLGSMYIFQSITWFIGGSHSYAPGNILVDIGRGKVFGIIPNQFLFLILIFIVFYLLDKKMILGKYVHAIGFNQHAVTFSGISANHIKMLTFVMSGVSAAVAGMMFLGKSWEINQTTGMNINIEVITLVVLGGTSVAGGVGSVTGTFIATLIISVMKKGLALMGMSGDVYNFVLGAVLVVSLISFAYLEKRKRIVSKKEAIKNLSESIG